jgi:hypothetical protein
MDVRLSRFLVTSAALLAAHAVGDHWIQTGQQACTKGEKGWAGRRACAAHVATYTATGVLATTAAAKWLSVPLSGRATALSFAVSAVTHYVADRREPLRRLAEITGSGGYVSHCTVRRGSGDIEDTGPGTGLFHLDQSWHLGWIFAAALVAAGRP